MNNFWQDDTINYKDIKTILKEILFVHQTNTIANPMAMVIHLHTAIITKIAVAGAGWL